MGYGSRSMTLLQRYYQGQFPNLGEQSTSARSLNTVENEVWGFIDSFVSFELCNSYRKYDSCG